MGDFKWPEDFDQEARPAPQPPPLKAPPLKVKELDKALAERGIVVPVGALKPAKQALLDESEKPIEDKTAEQSLAEYHASATYAATQAAQSGFEAAAEESTRKIREEPVYLLF